ncbi:MAG: hypothetical protein E6772_16630 [Dysgonomonas sp.]|nr:hypothetical protein [Dysgonomonas sp.]
MKKEHNINPLLALLLIVLLYLLGSTLENKNIQEDLQAQKDCQVQDFE